MKRGVEARIALAATVLWAGTIPDFIREPSSGLPTQQFPALYCDKDEKTGQETSICASKVGIESAEYRMIERIVDRSSISEGGKKTIRSLIQMARTMYQQGRVTYYEWLGDIVPRAEYPGVGDPSDPKYEDFHVLVFIPKNQEQMAGVLESNAHETLHAVRAFERFLHKQDIHFDRNPLDEELEAEYYGDLVGYAAIGHGIRGREAIEERYRLLGSKSPYIVGLLDQRGIGPDNRLYHYIFAMRDRYVDVEKKIWLESMIARFGKSSQLSEELRQVEEKLRKAEEPWEGFPPQGSLEAKLVEEIKEKGFVKEGFFPK